jgi:hypothetical protein
MPCGDPSPLDRAAATGLFSWDDFDLQETTMATDFADEVFRIRREHAAVFPSRQRIHRFVEELVDLLFPHLSGEN